MWQEILALDSLVSQVRGLPRSYYSSMAHQQQRQQFEPPPPPPPTSSSSDNNSTPLYLKRRLQLLSGGSVSKNNSQIRKRYISLRVKLLKRQFGLPNDLLSLKSLSLTPTTSASTPFTSTATTTTASSANDPVSGFKGVHQILDGHHTRAITRFKFGHNSLLVAASLDGTLSIVRDLNRVEVLRGHGDGVLSMDLSESNEFIVSSSLDGAIILWDTHSGKQLRRVSDLRGGMAKAVRFLPRNNNFVVCALTSGAVQIMNVSTGKFVSSSPVLGTPISVEINHSGSLVWVGNDGGIVESFKLDSNLGKIVKGCRVHVSNEKKSVISLSARNSLSSGSAIDDPYLLVNIQDSESVFLYRVVDDFGTILPFKSFRPEVDSAALTASTFAPILSFRQGTFIAAGSQDGSLYFLDLEKDSKPCINKLQGHLKPVIALGFSSDESFFASADTSGQIIIWKK